VWGDHIDPSEIDELVVVAERDRRVFELAETVDVAPDSAAILRRVVGASVVSNGPLSGMAQYRGMSRFRVGTQINGSVVSAGGPNWMDPPLSYAPAAWLESIEVQRGIASVGAGLETIGGAISANTWRADFSESAPSFGGRVRTGARSVNDGYVVSAALAMRGREQVLQLSGLTESGDDGRFRHGDVVPSEYTRTRIDVGYGFRTGAHSIRLDYGRNETGDAGTPVLPMDISYIDADLGALSWEYAGDVWHIGGKLYASDIDHGMSNYHLRTAPAAPGMWRRNVTAVANRGFALDVTNNGWRAGVAGHREVHDSDITNPNNPTFFATNFNNAERQVLGVYVEREWLAGDAWVMEMGVRYNRVTMDADTVDATPAVIGMPPAVALRDAFNGADRSQTDDNVDWVAKFNYLASDQLTYYLGVARKSRSPAYQERYLWLPLQATAGLGDGLTYTGDVELRPEVAHEIEFGVDWQHASLTISPRLYYKEVEDYVQGIPSTNAAAVMLVRMMNMANGSDAPAPLQFSNVDATLYGVDVDWRFELSENWMLNGVLNYVRAKRDDVGDDLYRVAAPNALFALNYTQPKWGMIAEAFVYDGQSNVSTTNNETSSSGYGLVNLKGWLLLSSGLKLGFGVDNVADREYSDHLAGVSRVRGNEDVPLGDRLPGYGRNFFARLDYSW
jgi:iron complex outermembrane receptor protein